MEIFEFREYMFFFKKEKGCCRMYAYSWNQNVDLFSTTAGKTIHSLDMWYVLNIRGTLKELLIFFNIFVFQIKHTL